MRFRWLEVKCFRGIRHAEIELRSGLNLLVGPNEAGKSTLAHAVRAVLLCKCTSSETAEFWSAFGEGAPEVTLRYETEDARLYQIHKRFGDGGTATLSWSRDGGATFSADHRGDAADVELQNHLSWGLRTPGGRGGPRGIQSTYLSQALLAEQTKVASILEARLEEEGTHLELIKGALAAAVEDPRFKRALAAAQNEVDRYYTTSGVRRRTATSPWKKAQDAINQAQRELDEVERKAAEVTNLMAEVSTRRTEAEEARVARDEVVQQIQMLEAHRAALQARLQLEQVAQQARKSWAEGEARELLVQSLATDLEMAQATVQDLESEVCQAEEELKLVRGALEARQAELREVQASSDGAQLQLQQSELDRRIDAMTAEAQRVDDRRRDAETLAAQEKELAWIQEQYWSKSTARAKLAETAKEAEERIVALDREITAARACEAIDATTKAREQLERAQVELDRATVARDHLMRLEEEEKVLAEKVERAPGLDHPTVKEVRNLFSAWDKAKASASAGLSIKIDRLRPVELGVRVDDGEASPRVADTEPAEIEAQRSVEIDLGDVARISVAAGAEHARRELAEAERGWRERGAPVLARHSVATVEALDELLRQVETDRQSLTTLRAERGRVAALAALFDDAERLRAEAQEALAAAQAESARWAHAPQIASSKPRTQLEAARAGAEKLKQAAATDLAAEEGELRQLDARVGAETSAVDAGRQRLGGSSADVLAETQRRRAEIESEVMRLREERIRLAQDLEEKLSAARARLEAARDEVQKKAEADDAAQVRFGEATTQRATLEGKLELAREERAKVDLEALASHLEGAEARLAEAPRVDFSEAELEEAQNRLQSLSTALAAAEAELNKALGALDKTDGPAARQRLDDAHQRLDEKRRAQQDVQVDAEAAQLVVEVLKEAESKLAKHIGATFGERLAPRFAELTQQRYTRIEVDKKLTTTAVVIGSARFEPDKLSVGTREQLATLIRVILAEQLGHPVVLDDQLVQSDSERLRWFRDCLAEAAQKTQVIVLSCRKEDYLDDGPAIAHVIDVERAVKRWSDLERRHAEPAVDLS
jgi:chromosome segregation ATPase